MWDSDAATLNAHKGMHMRKLGWIGLAAVVATGLLWSLSTLTDLVPVDSAEMRSTPPISADAEARSERRG